MSRLKPSYVMALVVAMLVAGYIVNELRFVDDKPEISGIVIAIDDAPANEKGFTKVAVVQLANGSSLRANILPACTVSQGQLAHAVGGRSSYFGRSYVVMTAEDPK